MKRVLWISLFIPYDKVRHAGGKIHNYYLKALRASNRFDIKLLTFAEKSDLQQHDLDKYGIQYDIICHNKNMLSKLGRLLINAESTYNPYNRYGRALQNYDILKVHSRLKQYVRNGYVPDIVILHWTQIAFMLTFVKKCFPNARIVTVEEDVTYLSYQRKMHYYPRAFMRYISKLSYNKVKKLELGFLHQSDLVILNNHKDEKLIINDGISKDKIFVWTPFFQNYLDVNRTENNHNIIFYGGMDRQENYLSAIWFAENVMPRLKDTDVEFIIIGANPDKSLYKYCADNIHIMGYVEHVEYYLSEALCLVAPLVFGAGVKIKILESLSVGIPILTNEVGIEGIDVKAGEGVFLCDSANQYEEVIRKLLDGGNSLQVWENREKEFIRVNYNLEQSVMEFIDRLEMF